MNKAAYFYKRFHIDSASAEITGGFENVIS